MAPTHPNLRDTQKLVWKLIAWPEGVPDALKRLKLKRLPVTGGKRLSAAQRLDIYADMYFYRILDGLKEDFPALLRLTGETHFHNLATHYLAKHPSTHYSLRNAGARLESFLRAYPLHKRRPYLGELAGLEWAMVESFDAPDSPTLTQAMLAQVPPDRWPGLRFRFSPSVRLLAFEWNTAEQREKLLRKGKPPPWRRRKNRVLLWRRDFKVYYRELPPLEGELLNVLMAGKAFADACRRAAKEAGPQQAPMAVALQLQNWIAEGLIAGADQA